MTYMVVSAPLSSDANEVFVECKRTVNFFCENRGMVQKVQKQGDLQVI